MRGFRGSAGVSHPALVGAELVNPQGIEAFWHTLSGLDAVGTLVTCRHNLVVSRGGTFPTCRHNGFTLCPRLRDGEAGLLEEDTQFVALGLLISGTEGWP